MKKIYPPPISIVILLLTLLVAIVLLNNGRELEITCHSTLVTGNNQVTSWVRVSFFLEKNSGQINFDGVTNSNGNKDHILRRATSFTFTRRDNIYIINNSSVSELPGNTAPISSLKGMFPAFMLVDNASYRFNIYPIGNSAYLFMSDGFITLYCNGEPKD